MTAHLDGSVPAAARLVASIETDRIEQIRPPARRRHQYRTILLVLAATVVVTRNFVTTEFGLSLTNQWIIYSMAAVGFSLIFCVAGRFAFCQTFMMATGAYTAAYIARDHAFWAGIAAGVVAVVVLATLFGLLVRKTEAFYFSIATLALSQLGTALFTRWTDFTGPSGLASNVPIPEIFGRRLVRQADMFWMLLAGLAICLLVAVFVDRSPLAREAIAARDLPELATTAGISTQRVQLAMFVIGSALGGLAGALTAYWQGSVSTESFGLALAIGIFLMPMVGGVDSVWGPVAGALLYIGLPQALSDLEKYSALIYGIALVLAIIALPSGIIGTAQHAWQRRGQRTAPRSPSVLDRVRRARR